MGVCFILVLLNHIIKKTVEKSQSQKRLNFRVGSNWHIFWFLFFLFLSITSFKIIQIQNVGWVPENSGNFQQDEHKNCQNWWSWQPQKLKQQKLSQFEPTLKSCFFWGWDFFNFFFNYMPQKYQNEKSPILNDQKKPRTWGKVQKIRNWAGVGLFHPFENTLYVADKNLRYLLDI